MSMAPKRWKELTPSRFPWEREALAFVRERLPDRDPYVAWSLFEFIADDGSINEVDLLILTPRGLFLVEIKSRPGVVDGDASIWRWRHEGKTYSKDNPLISANRKARKLASLLKRQKEFEKSRCPFIEALVFLSAPDQICNLQDNARMRVCLRDHDNQPGIIAALNERKAMGLRPDGPAPGVINAPVMRALSRSMEQAGIRPSQRSRRVGDYLLGPTLYEGPYYQDREATHVGLPKVRRRVRLYNVEAQASEEARRGLQRAVQREYEILDGIHHSCILRAFEYKEHDLGPALVFEHEPGEVRLDHFVAQHADRLSVDDRLSILRQIAEAINYAHGKRLVHRALGPQSILVTGPNAGEPGAERRSSGPLRIRVFNWQVGHRRAGSSFAATCGETAISQIDQLVDEASQVYMAPEARLRGELSGEQLDVFSLGALAYFLFSGEPPAASVAELDEKLRTGRGLQIASVINGAGAELSDMIRYSTHPDVMSRIPSVQSFLEHLDLVENELTAPDEGVTADPLTARKGEVLAGGFKVVKQLGSGSTARALLVERDDQQSVLKIALKPEFNDRLADEAEVLAKLRHQFIVEYYETLEFNGLRALRLQHAGEKTLAERLREEGRLHLDLLQRFGEDLLQAVDWLEQQGLPHRDIKPANIGITAVGRGDKLHLVLFDFSLSRAPADHINVGTTPYLDPFLKNRRPRRWDLQAERFAAAMTLHEMATGTLPRWGDGTSDPALLDCEATIEAELFEPAVREGMVDFFTRALRRDPHARFDNCEDMLRQWRQIFERIDAPVATRHTDDEADMDALLRGVTPATAVASLELSTRALNALDRLQILTISDLLAIPLMRVYKMRGVGDKTRRELGKLVKALQQRFPNLPTASATAAVAARAGGGTAAPIVVPPGVEPEAEDDPAVLSIDLLALQILGKESHGPRRSEWQVKTALLGFEAPAESGQPGSDSPPSSARWPSQTEISQQVQLTRSRVGQVVIKLRERWSHNKSLQILRDDIADKILPKVGGVMTAEELGHELLSLRGSTAEEPLRTRQAAAVLRAAIEIERGRSEPRFMIRRSDDHVLVATTPELADYALRLGRIADHLADTDPLPAPARVHEVLQGVPPPAGAEPLLRNRLVRLAGAASDHAAVSSRLELYPCGMDPLRALKLAHGALLGSRTLTAEQIHQRVASRYPAAAPLPERPALDALLRDAGWDFTWDPTAAEGVGAYVSPFTERLVSSSGTSLPRYPTTLQRPAETTPEIATARQFEERLQHAAREGAFLVLMTHPRALRSAAESLQRYDLDTRHLDQMLIQHIKTAAETAKIKWQTILRADAAPKSSTDWSKLQLLVARAVSALEQELRSTTRTVLLLHAGLLARYDQLDLLERLRDAIGRLGGPHGIWLLVTGDQQHDMPLLNGRAVPLISPGQRLRIPDEWLANVHRSAQAEARPAPA